MTAAHEQLTTFKSSLSEVITSPTDETQCGNCDRMVIASEFKVLTDVKNTCLRGDRPNWRNNDSCFSSIKQKTSPGPYVGLDDGLGGNGTSLWTAHATHGGTSTIVTSNLAGIKCGIEAAVSKPAQTFVEKQGMYLNCICNAWVSNIPMTKFFFPEPGGLSGHHLIMAYQPNYGISDSR